MAEYVLVGGAWLGGWCWQKVARRLRDDGHDAYPVTLTGLGERAHLASPQVDLETHITDVVNLIEYEGLGEVVLVGHSYGGLVITGAADRVTERISRLVYVDTVPPPDGGALIDKFPPELRRRAEVQVEQQGEGWRYPMPPEGELAEMASLEGLDDYRLALLRSRATPQPFGTYTQPLRLTNPARGTLPKVGIACSFSPKRMREMIAGANPPVGDRPGPGWRFVGLPTGHYAMLSRPEDLAGVLLGLAPAANF